MAIQLLRAIHSPFRIDLSGEYDGDFINDDRKTFRK